MKYFDLHCDTIGECHLQKQPLYRNHLHLDLSRGAEFSAWTQCFAILDSRTKCEDSKRWIILKQFTKPM